LQSSPKFQGDTNSGQQNKRALSIIRSREARENGPSAEDSDKSSKDKEGGKDKGGDEEGEKSKEMELDDDGDGIPDGKQKKERSWGETLDIRKEEPGVWLIE